MTITKQKNKTKANMMTKRRDDGNVNMGRGTSVKRWGSRSAHRLVTVSVRRNVQVTPTMRMVEAAMACVASRLGSASPVPLTSPKLLQTHCLVCRVLSGLNENDNTFERYYRLHSLQTTHDTPRQQRQHQSSSTLTPHPLTTGTTIEKCDLNQRFWVKNARTYDFV